MFLWITYLNIIILYYVVYKYKYLKHICYLTVEYINKK